MANGKAAVAMLGLCAITGCGSTGASRTTPAAEHATATGTTVDLDPDVTGRELMRLKRVGAQMGTSDLVKYGSDGSAVAILAYGGGGEKIMRCRLRSAELDALTQDLRRLPLDRPESRPEPARTTFYTAPPAQYTLTAAGHRIQTFTEVEMPRDARPLVRRLERTLDGRAARCHTVYRSRRA